MTEYDVADELLTSCQRKLASHCLARHILPMERGGWTYIMTNRPYGVLYVGVTAHLAARILQHRNGEGSEFCRRYRLDRLVLIERHERIEDAILREKALKAWKRDWKLDLIDAANPQWQDLWDTLQG